MAEFQTFDLGRAYSQAQNIKESQQIGELRGLQIEALRNPKPKEETPAMVADRYRLMTALGTGALKSSDPEQVRNSAIESISRGVQLGALDPQTAPKMIEQLRTLPPEQVIPTVQQVVGQYRSVVDEYDRKPPEPAKPVLKMTDTTKPGPYGEVFGQVEEGTGKFDPYANPSQPHKPDKIDTGFAKPIDVQRLRKEFRSLQPVKDYETVLPLIQSAAKAPKTPAGDLQLIYTVGKIFDPGSVVREGELQLTQDAQPWLRKMIGQYQKQVKGGAVLGDDVRAQFMDALNQRVGAYQQAYKRDFDQYSEYARELAIAPEMVVGTAASSAYEQQPNAASTPPAVTGDVQFDYVPGKGLVPRR